MSDSRPMTRNYGYEHGAVVPLAVYEHACKVCSNPSRSSDAAWLGFTPDPKEAAVARRAELLSAIDWDWFLENPPSIDRGFGIEHRSPEEVVGDKIAEGLPKAPINVFENPGAIGDRVRHGAFGSDRPAKAVMDLLPEVQTAIDAAGGRCLSEIHEGICCTDSPEGEALRSRRSILYRLRYWIGTKVAALAAKINP